ncbi:MAG: recombination protein RecR [Spirochaetales bacterium]|nr:recombination protein RecR [Spirochaetales bacterium]
MNTLELLIRNLSKLPGVGRKSAARIAYFLLKRDESFARSLGDQILSLKQKIKQCSECGNYTEIDPCPFCTDPQRDKNVICVVEESRDVHTIESTGEFHGLYHVLQGTLSPIDGIGPEDLTISRLISRIRKGRIDEIIIATNPTVEGDTTALYIVKMLSEYDLRITRLASGLPVGGDLEYADRLTLARSLKGRTPFGL